MSNIILFEEKQVRRAWDKGAEKWVFAIVDVIAVLTGSPNPQVYGRVMKKRLRDEGNQTVTNCNALETAALNAWELTFYRGTNCPLLRKPPSRPHIRQPVATESQRPSRLSIRQSVLGESRSRQPVTQRHGFKPRHASSLAK